MVIARVSYWLAANSTAPSDCLGSICSTAATKGPHCFAAAKDQTLAIRAPAAGGCRGVDRGLATAQARVRVGRDQGEPRPPSRGCLGESRGRRLGASRSCDVRPPVPFGGCEGPGWMRRAAALLSAGFARREATPADLWPARRRRDGCRGEPGRDPDTTRSVGELLKSLLVRDSDVLGGLQAPKKGG